MISDDNALISDEVTDPDSLILESECAAATFAVSKQDIPLAECDLDGNTPALRPENVDAPKFYSTVPCTPYGNVICDVCSRIIMCTFIKLHKSGNSSADAL